MIKYMPGTLLKSNDAHLDFIEIIITQIDKGRAVTLCLYDSGEMSITTQHINVEYVTIIS
jgi:hypothetical protein